MDFLVAITISLLCLIVFCWVWQLESYKAIVFTPFLLAMFNDLIRVMPSFGYAAAVGISEDCYPLLVFFGGFASFVAGFLFAAGYMRYRSRSVSTFLGGTGMHESGSETAFIIAFGVAVLVALGLVLYEGVPTVIDVLRGVLFGEEIEDVARFVGSARREITKGHHFGSSYRGQGIIRAYNAIGWPFISAIAFLAFLRRGGLFWLAYFGGVLFLSFVFLAGDGTRGRFLNLVIILFVVYSFVRRLRWSFLLLGFLLVVLLGILMSVYSPKMGFLLGDDRFILEAVIRMFERIFLGNGINDVLAIELLRNGTIEYRLGSVHVRDLVAAMPGVAGSGDIPFAHELYLLLNPRGTGTTYATGTYISKAYVDFGIVGVGGIFVILGAFVGVGQKLLFQRRVKLCVTLALMAMISFHLGALVLTGPISLLVSMMMLVSFYALLLMARFVWRMKVSGIFSSRKVFANSDKSIRLGLK